MKPSTLDPEEGQPLLADSSTTRRATPKILAAAAVLCLLGAASAVGSEQDSSDPAKRQHRLDASPLCDSTVETSVVNYGHVRQLVIPRRVKVVHNKSLPIPPRSSFFFSLIFCTYHRVVRQRRDTRPPSSQWVRLVLCGHAKFILASGASRSVRPKVLPRFTEPNFSFARRLKAVRERETHLHLAQQFRLRGRREPHAVRQPLESE